MSLPLAVERSSAGAPASQPAADEREFVISRVFVAPKRLVFVVSFSDEKAGVTRHPFSADWPLEVLKTLTLAEREGRTTLKLRGVPVNATEAEWRTFDAGRSSMQQGFKGTLDQLAAYLAKA